MCFCWGCDPALGGCNGDHVTYAVPAMAGWIPLPTRQSPLLVVDIACYPVIASIIFACVPSISVVLRSIGPLAHCGDIYVLASSW